jgi:uncharacterized protein (DUF488 family)
VATLYTIGHSTRTLEELIAVLRSHSIQTLVDIRAFPVSRRLPHFNRESVEPGLAAAGIRYLGRQVLGGYRKQTLDHSPNTALRNASFRNYADSMMTPQFEQAATELVKIAESSRTASMCAERLWFHCHRMLVSDWLVTHGHTVWHIDGAGGPKPHRVTGEARLVGNQLIYSGDTLFS